MPEAPELTVVREVLERRLVGLTIDSGKVVRPTVLRNLVPDEFEARISPFRKRGELSLAEIGRLHTASHCVSKAAVSELCKRMGENVHLNPII